MIILPGSSKNYRWSKMQQLEFLLEPGSMITLDLLLVCYLIAISPLTATFLAFDIESRSQFRYIFKIKKCSFTNARKVAVKGEIAIK